MKTLHIFPNSVSADQSWELLNWCIAHGADDFSVGIIGTSSMPETIASRLQPFAAGNATRHLFTNKISNFPTWRLNADSIALLKSLLPEGLFTYGINEQDQWLEDPIVFRNGGLFLGIVTHEAEGVLRITDEEESQLNALGLALKHKGKWVDYQE